jgi:excisionase family DNA binding protein
MDSKYTPCISVAIDLIQKQFPHKLALTIPEVAQILGITKDGVAKQLKRGRLDSINLIKNGSRYLFPILELAKYLCPENRADSGEGLAVEVNENFDKLQKIKSKKELNAMLDKLNAKIFEAITVLKTEKDDDTEATRQAILNKAKEAHNEALNMLVSEIERMALMSPFDASLSRTKPTL